MRALSRSWLFVFATMLVACAAAPPPAPAEPASPRAMQLAEARALMAQLPKGADGCVVVWPSRLSERRRRLAGRLSSSTGLPYVAPEGPRVYVEARRARPDGGVSRVMLWSFSGSPERLRHFVLTRSPLATRFEASERAGGTYTARFVAPRRLRMSRGAWPESLSPGVERACSSRLGDAVERGALELSVRRGIGDADRVTPPARLPTEASAFGPTPRVRWLLPSHGGLRQLSRERFPSARARERVQGAQAAMLGTMPESLIDDVLGYPESQDLDARTIQWSRRVSFEDLELLAQDDADRRRAALQAERAQVPVPVAAAPVATLEALQRQLNLRRIQLEITPASELDARRRELLELLRRGQRAHPLEPAVVIPFVHLLLALDQDAPEALSALAALRAGGTMDEREVAPLRREALSYASEEALASALVEELSLSQRAARRAAHALVEARQSGSAYEAAEGLWLAQEALDHARLRAIGRAPRGVSWPMSSLPESAAALIDEAGLERPLYVVVRAPALRGDAGNLPEALGRYVTLHFSDDVRGVWVLGATTRGDHALARLGALLDSRVRGGAVDITVAVVPFGTAADRPSAWLRAVGHVEGGRLELTRLALGGAPDVRWQSVAALLADPLASAGTQVFPAPTLDIMLPDVEQAQSVAAALDASADCAPRPGGLVCRPRGDRGALSRALGLLCRSATP